MVSKTVPISIANNPNAHLQLILMGEARQPIYGCVFNGISYRSGSVDPNGLFRYGSVFKHPEDFQFDTCYNSVALVVVDSFVNARLDFMVDSTNECLIKDLVIRTEVAEAKSEQCIHLVSELTNQVHVLKNAIDSFYGFESVPKVDIGIFGFSSTNIETFDIPLNAINAPCKQWCVHYFLRCGSEAPSRSFFVKIWTTVNGKDYVQYVSGARYGQNAISFDSGNLWFPAGSDGKVRVQCDDVQLTNCHVIQFSLVGYR